MKTTISEEEIEPVAGGDVSLNKVATCDYCRPMKDCWADCGVCDDLHRAGIYDEKHTGEIVAISPPSEAVTQEFAAVPVNAALIDKLETLDDCMSRAPWTASPRWPETQELRVRIGEYEYTCPKGSGQIRAEEADIPSGCLVPFGVIHQDDAEGISELRNLVPDIIAAIRAAPIPADEPLGADKEDA